MGLKPTDVGFLRLLSYIGYAGDRMYCETATDAYNASVSETQNGCWFCGSCIYFQCICRPVGSKFNDSGLTCSGEAYADGASIITHTNGSMTTVHQPL